MPDTPGRPQPSEPARVDEPHTPGAAAPRLAAALGWEHVPVVSEEQQAKDRADLAEALADARRRDAA